MDLIFQSDPRLHALAGCLLAYEWPQMSPPEPDGWEERSGNHRLHAPFHFESEEVGAALPRKGKKET